MEQTVRPFTVMAKPISGMCNLACAYCYYLGKPGELYPSDGKLMMDRAVLESYTRQYLAAMPENAGFNWQGGEPLLAGLDFYRQAVKLQAELCGTAVGASAGGAAGDPFAPGQERVYNAIQTNGTLLNDAWCEFFRKHKFLVGISLDGPQQWHDHYRRDRAGDGAFGRAWAGLELLRKHSVEFNVLATLNARNVPHAGDVYRWFTNQGVRWLQFIPILERDAAGRPTAFSCTGEQFGRFMLEVLELWLQRDMGIVSERLIDSVLHTVVHGVPTVCCNSRACANAFVLEWNGDLYACDHYVYQPWRLGNIMETPLAELAASAKVEEFSRLKTALPDACRDCEYLPYCNGGCPKHHVLPDGVAGAGARASVTDYRMGLRDRRRVNHFCDGYKLFFRHALPELKRLGEYVRCGTMPPPDWRKPQAHTAGAPTALPGTAAAPGTVAVPTAPSSGAQAKGRPGRNDLCPCGSRRKFKHCCGRQ